MAYKIESGIPPCELKYAKRAWYRDMNIGDSVVADRQMRHYLQRRFWMIGWGFRAKQLPDKTYRVWRVEPTNAI